MDDTTTQTTVDANGDTLTAGDRVKVSGSDRFGEAEGTFVASAPDEDGRNNPRVRVDFDAEFKDEHEIEDEYTASVQRVTKVTE